MLYLGMYGYGYSKTLCRKVCDWFMNNNFPRHSVYLDVVHRGLKREGAYGYCDVAGSTYKPREFLIELDTYMNRELYIQTLLHELYHLKQFISGELKIKASKRYFRGECVENLEYYEQPHEIFARWHERVLYNKFITLT